MNMVNNMAKKKTSKDADSKSFQYSVELTGLVLVLIGLIGFGFGPVGAIIKKFAMFLTGEWWPLILMLVLWLGLYMIIKRKLPKFLTSRLIGFYIIFIVILVASHFRYIEDCKDAKDIFQTTLNNYMERIANMPIGGPITASGPSNINIGGGVIGAVFAVLFSTLFGITGTIIVLTILGIFGFIILFDITLSDVWVKMKAIFSVFKREKKSSEESEEDDEEDDKKLVITDVRELDPSYQADVPKEVSAAASDDNHTYILPSLEILDNPKSTGKINSTEFIKNTKTTLEKVLKDFQINGQVTEIHVGPAVTQYEVSVPAGTKVNRIVSINREIALALSAKDVRIQAPIPGKNTIGVEIPNQVISAVRIKEILGNIPKGQESARILVSLGKDIMGRPQTADISKMPHLLVAGSTGSGKSVCINSFITSILMRYTPDEVKLILVDPKKVELSNYNGVPHLLCPVVTDPKKASIALQKIVGEMEKRYDMFEEAGVKNIDGYNEKYSKNKGENKPIPYIVVIIDELADLMLIAAKEVEDSIMRITQMARAAGIHLVVATQRPSTDVITGIIKANIPSRISFAVASYIDSRTILDAPGAEKLLGKGDMLYLPMGENSPIRIQGSFISDDEISRIIDYVVKEKVAEYDSSLTNNDDKHLVGGGEKEEYDDPMYNEVVEFAVKSGKVSASLLQRRFRVGYNRAARIVDLLEERGIIGPQNGSKPRDVLVKLEKPASDDEE